MRGVIRGEDKRRQLLGVGFKGSFFGGTRDSFSDENTIYVCFTEQFRIVGSIFLNFVGHNVRQHFADKFGIRVHVRVPPSPTLDHRLLCHFVMEKVWHELLQTPLNVRKEIRGNFISLMKSDLHIFLNGLVDAQQMTDFLGLASTESMQYELEALLGALCSDSSIEKLSESQIKLLRGFGDYMLHQKMYPCVE